MVAIGYLRSAFLLGFATWGYTFAVSNLTAMIRAQIQDPDEDIFDDYLIFPNEPVAPGVGMIKESITCLAISILDVIVLLPNPSEMDKSFYEQLPSQFPNSPTKMQFKLYSYPKHPEYNRDHHILAQNNVSDIEQLTFKKPITSSENQKLVRANGPG